MEDYIVLDLETPNKLCNSMSSIGIVVVENGEVVDEIYSLINPEAHFDSFNISFTGIHPEDVVDAPTFPEFYDEIGELLEYNVIVGQNITFDLGVISRSLTRYCMPIPPFEYYCTLRSCRRNLSLPDNSLSYIVSHLLCTTYDAHNAMADAQMTYELFNILGDYEDNREDFLKTFYYWPKCKRDFDRNLDFNYNYLYGLLKKFNYISGITENHRTLIETWYESNKCYDSHPLIQNMLLKVSYILSNKRITKKELRLIINSLKPIKRSPQYKVYQLKYMILKGLIDSIICEDKIAKEDTKYLYNWIKTIPINENQYKEYIKQLDYNDNSLLKKQLKILSKFLEENILDDAVNKNFPY